MFLYSPLLACITFVPLPAGLVFVYTKNKKMKAGYREIRKKNGNFTAVLYEILKLLKIENMAESFAGGKSQIISSETILKENPDVIIGTMKIKSPEEIVSSNEFLKYSNAYKNNNIYVFESEKILRATPRIVDGIEEIYEVIKNVEK